MKEFNPKFSKYDKVIHISNGSPEGIIINISYLFNEDEYRYRVAFAYNDVLWFDEIELKVKDNNNKIGLNQN